MQVPILNVSNLNVQGLQALLSFCDDRVSHGRGAFLIPMNPIKVVKARSHPDFQEIIDHADWVFPDAWGMKWAARLLHDREIELCPGYRVMFEIVRQAEERGHAVYLLGTTDEALARSIVALREKHPRLRIVGSHNGFFDEAEEEAIFEEIRRLEPDFVFVAMGEYLQEKVIQRARKVWRDAVYMGVGGSLDLLAGLQPKPPDWIRRNHLEWVYRLVRQPFRAPRFKALPIFAWRVLAVRVTGA